MILEENLVEFGLNQKEAKVYLGLLELGESKVHEIAHKVRIARPSVYDILEKLITKGWAGAYDKHKIRHYVAFDPETIKIRLAAKQKTFETLLPELKSVYNTLKAKPKISYYEGIEGIKLVLEDTIVTPDKHLRGILSMVDLYQIPGKKFMDDYVQRRIKTGYALRVIRSKPKDVGETWPTDPAALRTLHYAPTNMIFAMTMYIYHNKIGIISSSKENFGMIIESLELNRNLGNLFEALWQMSMPV